MSPRHTMRGDYTIIARADKAAGNVIFVFGSNLAGRHGKGAALFARQWYEAKPGDGLGRTGRAYAIPTKDHRLNVLPLTAINGYVADFVKYAAEHPELTFRLTPVGTGLASYPPAVIAPMFKGAPANVIMPSEFKP